MSKLEIAFAAALTATACAATANEDLIVAITDESNSGSQQNTAELLTSPLPHEEIDVRLATPAGSVRFRAKVENDGRIISRDRFVECYSFARAVINAAHRNRAAPAVLHVTAGLMSAPVPLIVRIARRNGSLLDVTATTRGVLSDGQTFVPAGLSLEGVVGYDGAGPTSAVIRETTFGGNASLPVTATTCRMIRAPHHAGTAV